MRSKQHLGRRVRTAVRGLTHSFDYARHLVLGNSVSGDIGWNRPGSAPIVLAHGFLGTRGTMLPLTRRFRSDGRVVFSYSYGTFQTRSLRASAAELVAHLERLERELGVAEFDVVGFSMGGLVALHALKFMQGHRFMRRLALLGTPVSGTWLGLAGVATMGLVSPSVWQCLPHSGFLSDLRDAPVPDHVRVRQIHADQDLFCPLAPPIEGVDATRDYVVLPGGHSSLVVTEPFYEAIREFLDADEPATAQPASPRLHVLPP